MKKTVCKIICVIAALLALATALCAVTVTGNGFLDLSNIARFFFLVIALIFAITAIITGIFGWKSE